MSSGDIPWLNMGLLYLFLLIPIALFYYVQLPLKRQLLWAVLRMSLQLLLVGLYLSFLFDQNLPLLNFLWLLVMISIASHQAIRQASLRQPYFFPLLSAAMLLSLALILLPFLIGIAQIKPLYQARYLIPLAGMLLGNMLSSHVVGLHYFVQALAGNKIQVQSALCMGASPFEAALPMLRSALHHSFKPMISGMTTLGLVALPGMMTGQLLGGALPLVAIKYQIAIMAAIFSSSSLSLFLSLILAMRLLVHRQEGLREGLIHKGT